MPQIINTNIASLNAQRNLNTSQRANQTALERLSSGLRINSARDDAAGLAISTRFEAQTRGLAVAIRNANDGVSLAQTAEGALGAMTSNLLRIRDLALQSANATNSDVDREALNAEVQQLKLEIDRISEQTNFNGTKLLDGTFEDVTFQIGANENESITFGIAPATVDALGTSVSSGLSSTPSEGFNATTSPIPLAAGDLVINGVSIRASTGSDDPSSDVAKSSSAIAKAAAINDSSDLSGVVATVNENQVVGSDVTAGVAAAAYDITLNGIAVDFTLSATNSASANLQIVVDEVNAVSGQTGVVASFNGNLAEGIVLTAEDGRNITIVEVAGTASGAGLPAGAAAPGLTYAGSYTLVSKDGSNIDITSTTGDIDNAGLEIGSYSGVNAGAVNESANATTRTVQLASGDLVINGVAVPGTLTIDDTASTVNPEFSAIAIAAAINKVSESSEVTAEVNQNIVESEAITAGATGFSIDINGVTVAAAYAAADDTGTKQKITVDAINAVASQTGVRAEAFGADQFLLIADDGRNINFNTVTNTGTNAGFDAIDTETYYGSLSLVSGGQIELTTTTGNITNSGFQVGNYGGGESGQLLKYIDISTVDGALKALDAVDNALQTINAQRAELGAIQNRFESTIGNQEIAKENLSAANSRIRDADFASETAELSRTQTLQQAGLAILSQANAQPQQVLQLLQG